jgi:hypothetical protein
MTLEYKLIAETEYRSVEEEVGKAIKDGWQPLGGPSSFDPKQRGALLIQAMTREKPKTPYDIGVQLFLDGHGISSFWGAVKCDEDMPDCERGYMDAKAKVFGQGNKK